MLKNAKVLKVYRKELNTRRTREKIINEQIERRLNKNEYRNRNEQ